MLTMTQMDLAGNIIRVMEDVENYPDHSPADVLPDPTYDEGGENASWRFTEDGVLQTIDDATGDWAYAGSVSDEAWEYRTNPARGI
jgi:hypothetical protein